MSTLSEMLRTGAAVAALLVAAPVFAQTENDPNASGTVGGTTNSGPGVQGPPDTRTGPSTRGGEGASTGDTEHTTTPSQDSSGVQGLPGNKSGPSVRDPGEGSGNKMPPAGTR